MVVPIVIALGGAACGSNGAAAGDGAGAGDAESISVVASFYPLAFAAERVGDDAVSVTNLTPPGVEPHDLELTPDDIGSIAEADVVVYLGGGFQPVVEEVVRTEATGIIVNASEGLELLAPPVYGHDEEGDFEEGAVDPHLWLDPARYARMVERVAAALGEVSATDGEAVRANAETLTTELTALDEEFRRGLAECETRMLLTNHAAFGYLAAAYDLEQLAISGVSPESEPDAARIAELAASARADGVTTIFTEDLASLEVAETLAAEADLDTAVLSPLEGLSEEQVADGDDYLSVMHRNLETLRDGLICA